MKKSNLDGIVVTGDSNLIGTSGQDGAEDSAQKNLIVFNSRHGVSLESGATSNVVAGNLIEYNTNGLHIFVASNNWIGANSIYGPETTDQRNVISGNVNVGVFIANLASTDNVVAGNYIGVASDGTSPLANQSGGVGIFQRASGNLVGGSTAIEQNVIASNIGDGVSIGSSLTDPSVGNAVLGNSIFANSGIGIDLEATG